MDDDEFDETYGAVQSRAHAGGGPDYTGDEQQVESQETTAVEDGDGENHGTVQSYMGADTHFHDFDDDDYSPVALKRKAVLLNRDSVDQRALESMHPVPVEHRTWGLGTYIAMWAGISITPTGLIFGAALLSMGLSMLEAFIALVLGNVLLLAPLILNGLPGAKFGVPFPILARAAFGRRGALVAILLRGVVGVGWCGFQLWVGGAVLADLVATVVPSIPTPNPPPGGIVAVQGASLAAFTLMHIGAIYAGVARLQPMLRVTPAITSAAAFAMTCWAFSVATPAELYAATEELRHEAGAKNSAAVRVLVGATATCSGWSTLALNIADLSRYAKSESALVWGNVLMFPLANVAAPMLGVISLGACRHVYGDAVTTDNWNLTATFRYWSPAAGTIGAIVFILSVFTTNLVANVLSAGNDFASITPQWVGFRGGCFIALAGGIALNPWSSFASASGFVNGFMVCYSIITGAILGVMLTDYLLVQRRELSLPGLYARAGGIYNYTRGFNVAAAVAVFAAVAPCVPGIILVSRRGFAIGTGDSSVWILLYDLAWPVTVTISTAIYAGIHLLAARLGRTASSARRETMHEYEPLLSPPLKGPLLNPINTSAKARHN